MLKNPDFKQIKTLNLEFNPYITKYELSNLVGNRAVEISENKNLYLTKNDIVNNNLNLNDPLEIAEFEYKHHYLDDYYISREYPHKKYLVKRVGDLLQK